MCPHPWPTAGRSLCSLVCIAFGLASLPNRRCSGGRWLPQDVTGCVPGRSVRDISYFLQAKIEEALRDKCPRGGISLDIIKAFNNVPRAPAAAILRHLGIPSDVVGLWQDFLSKSQRCPVFAGGLGSPFGATTGVPEGDPLSVLAMVGLCWMASQTASPAGSTLRTYVDNFSWLGDTAHCLRDCLQAATKFCSALSLPIDWKKSYSWGTTHSIRAWLDTQAAQYLPAGAKLQRVAQAKDLGVCFRFSKSASLAKGEPRLAEGLRRLDMVARQPRPVSNKAALIQMGVWPQCFYAQEGRALCTKQVDHFRSKAFKALVQAGHSQSAAVAMACVSSRVVDPEVYLLTQCLLCLRRAFSLQPATAWLVLRMANEAFASAEKAIGPATALACMLRRNHWTLHEDGKCSGPGCVSLHLRYVVANKSSKLSRQPGTRNWAPNCTTVMAVPPWEPSMPVPQAGHFSAYRLLSNKLQPTVWLEGIWQMRLRRSGTRWWSQSAATVGPRTPNTTAAMSALPQPRFGSSSGPFWPGWRCMRPIESIWQSLSSIPTCTLLACFSKLDPSSHHPTRHAALIMVLGCFSQMGLAPYLGTRSRDMPLGQLSWMQHRPFLPWISYSTSGPQVQHLPLS